MPRRIQHIASAPGKVLIIGGYLVVESPNVGISIGVDARFETEVIPTSDSRKQNVPVPFQADENIFTIVVESPQFGKTFTFFVQCHEDSQKDADAQGTTTTTTPISPMISIFQDPSAGNASKNPFLAHAILYTLSYICTQGVLLSVEDGDDDCTVTDKMKNIFGEGNGRALHLVVRGANDFYSQQNYLKEVLKAPVCAESLRKVPPFANLIGDVSKTGLGSSAALTSSVVAALFHYARFQVFPHATKMLDTQDENEAIHRIAQSAHCVAQGKVGSGFDVYTACFGTCAYTRFAASKIEPLMKDKEQQDKLNAAEEDPSSKTNIISVNLDTLKNVVGNFRHSSSISGNDSSAAAQQKADEWVPRAVIPGGGSFHGLPHDFKLLLADIHAGGTETPGMVQKIFAWKKTLDASDENNLWNRVAKANIHCIEALLGLHQIQSQDPIGYHAATKIISTSLCGNDEEGWKNAVASSSSSASSSNEALKQFDKVRVAFAQCRYLLREVGEKAGVEVEPSKLTPVLDETMKSNKGVIAVGCPGAGGYDAIFALAVEYNDNNEAESKKADKSKNNNNGPVCESVEQFWENYKTDGLHVCPLLVRESGGGLKF